jgi:hypothetical protein
VLIAIRPFHGHLHPSVPLARSLCAAGHDVAFATERGFCQVVERCGFAARPAGVDPFAPSPPHAESYEFSDVVTREKVDDILRIATNWPFDLIVRDPTDFAGVIAAETLGVPQATLGFTRFCHPDWWLQILGSSLDVVRASLGLPLDPELRRLHPSLYIDTVPPWLQVTWSPWARCTTAVQNSSNGSAGVRLGPEPMSSVRWDPDRTGRQHPLPISPTLRSTTTCPSVTFFPTAPL